MGLDWPSIANVGGELPQPQQDRIRDLLDLLADAIRARLVARNLPPAAVSPLFRPWNLIVVLDAEKVAVYFTQLQGGVAVIRWLDRSSGILPFAPQQIEAEMGAHVVFSAAFARAVIENAALADAAVTPVVDQHLEAIKRELSIGRIGDLTGLQHLEPGLREFLNDHADLDRNVFVMMRFTETDQMREIHKSIVTTLARRGYVAIRADDRDYTGELWTNVEVCMIGCKLGIAVFEDIEQREFNPNVSLELGYMLGRQKRCLLLKEKRLPNLPADVIHRLYRPFDIFKIAETIEAQVGQWIDVDLGVS